MTGLRLKSIMIAAALGDGASVPEICFVRPGFSDSTVRAALAEAIAMKLFTRRDTSYEVRYQSRPCVRLASFDGLQEGPPDAEDALSDPNGNWRHISNVISDENDPMFAPVFEPAPRGRGWPSGFIGYTKHELAAYAEIAEQIVLHIGDETWRFKSYRPWYRTTRIEAFAKWAFRLREARKAMNDEWRP